MYRSIFIDLDDTVWAFTENARDTYNIKQIKKGLRH
jgi:hypothetical protein